MRFVCKAPVINPSGRGVLRGALSFLMNGFEVRGTDGFDRAIFPAIERAGAGGAAVPINPFRCVALRARPRRFGALGYFLFPTVSERRRPSPRKEPERAGEAETCRERRHPPRGRPGPRLSIPVDGDSNRPPACRQAGRVAVALRPASGRGSRRPRRTRPPNGNCANDWLPAAQEKLETLAAV